MFVPVDIEEKKLDILNHSCLTQRLIPVTCIDEYGTGIDTAFCITNYFSYNVSI